MRIVIFSDCHNRYNFTVPPGDLLIFAGDLGRFGLTDEIERFNDFLNTLPHPYKLVIAGNHDGYFETNPHEARQLITAGIYLEDDIVEIEGIKIYGSPWQPAFNNWAFNLPRRSEELALKWRAIPDNTDILITHGPPFGILDRIYNGQNAGCELLLDQITQRIHPILHVFGHIHESYGLIERNGTTFVNASVAEHCYNHLREPVVIDWLF